MSSSVQCTHIISPLQSKLKKLKINLLDSNLMNEAAVYLLWLCPYSCDVSGVIY